MLLEKVQPKIKKVSYNKRMQYEKDEFNTYQNFLYKRVIFGLSVYTPEEIAKMHFDKKKRVIKVSTRAQYILNLWKQELSILMSNRILEGIFPNSPLTKVIVEEFSTPDPEFTNRWDFKTLRISKKLIVDKLIEEKILPHDFYELKEAKRPKFNRPGTHISVL